MLNRRCFWFFFWEGSWSGGDDIAADAFVAIATNFLEVSQLSQKLFFVPQLFYLVLPVSLPFFVSALAVFHTFFIHCTKHAFHCVHQKSYAFAINTSKNNHNNCTFDTMNGGVFFGVKISCLSFAASTLFKPETMRLNATILTHHSPK